MMSVIDTFAELLSLDMKDLPVRIEELVYLDVAVESIFFLES